MNINQLITQIEATELSMNGDTAHKLSQKQEMFIVLDGEHVNKIKLFLTHYNPNSFQEVLADEKRGIEKFINQKLTFNELMLLEVKHVEMNYLHSYHTIINYTLNFLDMFSLYRDERKRMIRTILKYPHFSTETVLNIALNNINDETLNQIPKSTPQSWISEMLQNENSSIEDLTPIYTKTFNRLANRNI